MENSSKSKGSNALGRLWGKTGIHFDMIMLSLKGALPPAIALAAYQAPSYADIFTTRGYFVAVVALLSMGQQPRAKFLQTIFMLALAICLATAINLLMIFCAVKARGLKNNTGLANGSSGSIDLTPYDSSANAISGTFLFINVFLATFLKAKRPQLAVPALQYNFFSITSAIYAPSLPNMNSGLNFIRQLLITFLTGYAFATGVNLFIWPTTSRGDVKRKSAELLSTLKDCLHSYTAYTDGLAKDVEDRASQEDAVALVKTFKERSRQSSDLFGEINLALGFARKEVAFGKLTPDHLNKLYVGLREVLQPIMGLVTFLQITVDLEGHNASLDSKSSSRVVRALRDVKEEEWSSIMASYRESHRRLQEVMSQGLDHISIQLELKSRQKTRSADVENPSIAQPGDQHFAKHLERELHQRQLINHRLGQEWLNQTQDQANRKQKQQYMFLIMYLNFLLYNAGLAVLRQVLFADGLVADGTMRRTKFIFPGCRAVGSLMMGAVMDRDQDEAMGMSANNGSNIWVGDIFHHKKDCEHLPPATKYEKITDCFRRIPRALASPQAGFGLRVAVATLSITLAAFLEPSREFFLRQRGVWAASLTAIAMLPNFGASIPAFCMRIIGTAVAAGVSIALVYTADFNHAAIIVLFYLQGFGWQVLQARFPSHELTAIVGGAASIIIVGFQLQVETIGRREASQTQAYYPIYFLALYRLAAIAIGLAVAFFWSIFPFPVSSHGSLRQDTANTLYLLANYHSCIQATLHIYPRIGTVVEELANDHPVKRLEEARQEIFGKAIVILGRLREHLEAARFEPRIGGAFPHDQYEQVIQSLDHVFTYLTLLTYSSKAFIRSPDDEIRGRDTDHDSNAEDEKQWLKGLCDLTDNNPSTTPKLTLTLFLLAASVHNRQPLPPNLSSSHYIDPAEKLIGIAPKLMNLRHFRHFRYAAFMINQITGSLVTGEIAKLAELTKELVGEVDFSFYTMSSRDASISMSVNAGLSKTYASDSTEDESKGLVTHSL